MTAERHHGPSTVAPEVAGESRSRTATCFLGTVASSAVASTTVDWAASARAAAFSALDAADGEAGHDVLLEDEEEEDGRDCGDHSGGDDDVLPHPGGEGIDTHVHRLGVLARLDQ